MTHRRCILFGRVALLLAVAAAALIAALAQNSLRGGLGDAASIAVAAFAPLATILAAVSLWTHRARHSDLPAPLAAKVAIALGGVETGFLVLVIATFRG